MLCIAADSFKAHSERDMHWNMVFLLTSSGMKRWRADAALRARSEMSFSSKRAETANWRELLKPSYKTGV
jgi:hypothetical protein